MTFVKCEIAILLAGSVLVSCAPFGPESADSPPKDDCPGVEFVCIRVENNSDLSFDSFVVNFSGQRLQYGSLDAGQTSEYRRVDSAYRYAFTEAFSDGRRFVLQPIDYVGEKRLTPGNYTYRYFVKVLEKPKVGDDWSLHGYMNVRLVVDD